MKVTTAQEMRTIDNITINEIRIPSIILMENAGRSVEQVVEEMVYSSDVVSIFVGKGNNGGDGLAMARQLARRQYRVTCAVLRFGNPSDDNRVNMKSLIEQELVELAEVGEEDALPEIRHNDVVVDAIFGSGITRKVTGFPGRVIRHINERARTIVSVDIPSGLFGEDNSDNDPDGVVRADYTITFQFPFLSFFFRENEPFVGRWRVQDIGLHPEIIGARESGYRTTEPEDAAPGVPFRSRFSHKGTYGHALLIAGSYGMMGAALLAGRSALRSGTGLVTLHVPALANPIVQTAFPEALVSVDRSDLLFSGPPGLSSYSAVGIGPGLGTATGTGRGLKAILERVEVPLVIDADGLNLLAENPGWYSLLPEGTILTPHPGEFDRLAGKSPDGYQRHVRQKGFAAKYRVYVVLKGAYTAIATPDGNYWFNTTGNPGMATGGSGDVLTGMIAGLLAQGAEPLQACITGVYLHGVAGDLAAASIGQEAMIAGDMIDHLGEAFGRLSRNVLF